MSKIPTKYIEKMYNDVIKNNKEKSVIKQHSSYYGTNGIVWELEKTKMDDNRTVYYTLIHYGTKIFEIGTFDLIPCSVRLLGGYSTTDVVGINSLMYMFGMNRKILAHKKHDELYMELIHYNGTFRISYNEGFYVHAGDLRFYDE